ncbi:uncharacterized protein TNCV_648301 [Trichonephila clavipes]|uniref:Uncharacterized protein n=1 Tax=Trichonephila clavipes TaxID=2585209 RepID=A0A8X6ST32_TRICX|nr:uncharacterized protein TNCV_648301 [Trichonephila clavipes]
MTGTLPPLLDSVVGGGTPERRFSRVLMDPMLLCPGKGLVLPTTFNIEQTASTARFFILSLSNNEMSKKSPFAIFKALQAIGEPKSVKKNEIRRFTCRDKIKHSVNILSICRNISRDSPLLVTPHKSLNSCRGVISEPDLLCTSEAEILEGFSDQGVVQKYNLEARKLLAPPISQSYAQATKLSKLSATTQTDENITKIKCPPLKLLQPSSLPKPNVSPYIPSTSASSAQANLLTSSSPIAAISEYESVNPIPNNVPSTSNISAFPSNSGVQPTSASTSIQDTKLKAKTRARKREKEQLKKINDAIIEIKMAPHKPRKSTPEQDSEDEDMIEYNPDEFDPDDYVQKYYNIGEHKSVITPTCYKNAKNCQVIYSQFGFAIHQNDHQARRRFVEWAQNEIAVVPDFHKRILFSDEEHFWLNGSVNKQNCRISSEANPQVYVETPLHPEKLTVWCALWAGGILLQKR